MNKSFVVLIIIAIISACLAYWPTNEVTTVTENETLNSVNRKIAIDEINEIEVINKSLDGKQVLRFHGKLDKGTWRIINKHNYRADLSERIGDVIGAAINLKKGPLITADASRHAEMRLLSPLSTDSHAKNTFGQQIILRDVQGKELLNLIFGRFDKVSQCSYVRLGTQHTVYNTTAFIYLEADWLSWVHEKIFHHNFTQLQEIHLHAFAGKAMAENNIFQLNKTSKRWQYNQQSINHANFQLLLDHLMFAEMIDVIPRNDDSSQNLKNLGISLENGKITKSPYLHKLMCIDNSTYHIAISNALSNNTCYMLIDYSPGSTNAQQFSGKYAEYIFVIDKKIVDSLKIIPNDLIQ